MAIALSAAIHCANSDGGDSIVTLTAGGRYPFTDEYPNSGNRAMPPIGGDGDFVLKGQGATLLRSETSAYYG